MSGADSFIVDCGFAMYCPQCKVEYRQGFTRCADCEVDLVYDLPARVPEKVQVARAPVALLEGEELKPLQRCPDALSCADACVQLREAGIAFKVTEFSKVFGYQMEPRPEFEIAVPAAQYERAKEILGVQIELGEEESLPSEEEIHSVTELPAEDDIVQDERVSDEWDPANWHPEDATVEIWFGREANVASDKGWMIKLALNENHILFCADVQEDGTCRFFVRPEDGARAREIVREIVEGAPPV
jgi:hypothetical protein